MLSATPRLQSQSVIYFFVCPQTAKVGLRIILFFAQKLKKKLADALNLMGWSGNQKQDYCFWRLGGMRMFKFSNKTDHVKKGTFHIGKPPILRRNLHIRIVTLEPRLFAYAIYGSRGILEETDLSQTLSSGSPQAFEGLTNRRMLRSPFFVGRLKSLLQQHRYNYLAQKTVSVCDWGPSCMFSFSVQQYYHVTSKLWCDWSRQWGS